ncbi:MAG: LysM peptidoglycan-binding domain-containing protein [Chloroflexota bacterium]
MKTMWNNLLSALAALLLASLACNLPGLDWLGVASQPEPVPGPSVTIQAPGPDTHIAVGETFELFVSAYDGLGVVRLDVWVNDVMALSQTSPVEGGITPLILDHGMVGAAAGSYSLVARAYNSMGAMGESLAVQVTVSEAQVNQPKDGAAIYIAQAGDTIDSVARDTGNSSAAVQNANPGINNNLNPGQPVNIPHPPLPKPPAQPAPNPRIGVLPNPAPPAMGNLPPPAAIGNLPPQAPIGNLPPQAPAANLPPLQNGFNPPLAAPDSLKVSTSDCKVTLAWADKSSGETGFAIYRRQVPQQPAAVLLTVLPPDTTSFVDQVPWAGKFEYAVETQGKITLLPPDPLAVGIQQNNLVSSRSAPIPIEVKPSAACIQDPKGFKFVYFQPLKGTATNPDVWKMGLWYSVNDSPGRRIPAASGSYFSQGQWSTDVETLPLPASLFLNPNQPLVLKLWAVGETRDSFFNNNPRPDLGEARIAHNLSDLQQKKSLYEAKNGQFSVQYYLWTDEVKWTGQGTTTKIPAPTNLRVTNTSVTARTLAWDWNGDRSSIDRYLLYRSYSCPGMDTQILAPKMLTAAQTTTEVVFKTEPIGCAYRYQVSAFGRAGESPPSNAVSGDTQSAYAIAAVTFQELKINDMPSGPGGVELRVYANNLRRASDVYWVKEASYALNAWSLDGRRPNNSMGMSVGEKEFLTVGFSVSGVDSQGYVAQDSVCKGAAILPPVGGWKQMPWTVTIKSPDGACELTVELSGQKPQVGTGGAIVHPGADITITKVERIGNKVFAYIENKGPDDLPNNRIGFGVAWYENLPDGLTQLTALEAPDSIWVQSNLPQWVHLSDRLDEFLAQECKLGSGGSLETCDYKLYVPIYPYSESGDEKDANFTDPDPHNNQYYDDFERIGVMQ